MQLLVLPIRCLVGPSKGPNAFSKHPFPSNSIAGCEPSWLCRALRSSCPSSLLHACMRAHSHTCLNGPSPRGHSARQAQTFRPNYHRIGRRRLSYQGRHLTFAWHPRTAPDNCADACRALLLKPFSGRASHSRVALHAKVAPALRTPQLVRWTR